MTIPDEDRFALLRSPAKIKLTDKDDPSKSYRKIVFYFADYDRRQGMWLALERDNRPDLKPWNQNDKDEAAIQAMWPEIANKWLVRWVDELVARQDILWIDWGDSGPYLNNLSDSHMEDKWRQSFKRRLGIHHHCHYPYPEETGFLDDETLQSTVDTSEMLEIERKGPNVDLVSFRDPNKLTSELAFFRYAALPRDGFNYLREHYVLHRHMERMEHDPFLEVYRHPVMDDTGQVVVGFLTEYFEGTSLKENISRIFKLTHLQDLFHAIETLNQTMRLLHNRISYDNIIIDNVTNKPKLTELGHVTLYDSAAPDAVALTDVYALIRAIHAHVVRHPEEIEKFDPEALTLEDKWEAHPLVRIDADFEGSHPAEVCFNYLMHRKKISDMNRRGTPWNQAPMPSITREFSTKPKAPPELVDLSTYWGRDPAYDRLYRDPRPEWVRRPQRRLAERGAQFLVNGKIPTPELLKLLEPSLGRLPSVADVDPWIEHPEVEEGSDLHDSILEIRQAAAHASGDKSLPPASPLKRPRQDSDVGGREPPISTRDQETLNRLLAALKEATKLTKKAGEEAVKATEQAKEATEEATRAVDMINAARKVAATSLGQRPVPTP
ncbi:hypothetical protein QBC41DRAFT_10382 [Cercophora samala]|uniref:Protein kinase domain-containing protein n=1 Tax=Cercophora samala TaxID=330535 RepID=A0AA39Z8M5_9PEZI|nr:hypothetical protein QBC41DRAFT_10382 [Cercophora samala]